MTIKFDPTKKFKRRDGVEARLRYVGSTKKYHVFENPEGELDSYYLDGRSVEGIETTDDLVNIPEEKWRRFNREEFKVGWMVRRKDKPDDAVMCTAKINGRVLMGIMFGGHGLSEEEVHGINNPAPDTHEVSMDIGATWLPCGVKEAVQ